jgi:CheY-like chemotaxis protein
MKKEVSVLVVDDNEDVKALLTAAGRAAGVEVTAFTEASEAIKYLADRPGDADAVLVDLSMFPVDGITLIEQIRSLEKVAPRLAPLKLALFTAQNVDEVIRNVQRQYGVEKIFYKPINPIAMLREVKEWVLKD